MDCLAFKQIDEDVAKFTFFNNYKENCHETQASRKEVLSNIRLLLRCLVLWSRNSSDDKDIVCFTYGMGTMEILHRLLVITKSAEETFWIMIGIIRALPRPWTVEKSVM